MQEPGGLRVTQHTAGEGWIWPVGASAIMGNVSAGGAWEGSTQNAWEGWLRTTQIQEKVLQQKRSCANA